MSLRIETAQLPCKQCGELIRPRPNRTSVSQWAEQKFCSRKCAGRARASEYANPSVLRHRFEQMFVPEPMSGCWLWMGKTSPKGYGHFQAAGVEWGAHRFSWMLHRGDIADGLWVLHRCDNPPCVNPEHLFLGTHADNVRDAWKKGRAFKPSNPAIRSGPRVERAIEIKRLLALGERIADVARKTGVSPGFVGNVKSGLKWGSL